LDITQNIQITGGLNIYYGAKDTEFGGFTAPGMDLRSKAPDSAYLVDLLLLNTQLSFLCMQVNSCCKRNMLTRFIIWPTRKIPFFLNSTNSQLKERKDCSPLLFICMPTKPEPCVDHVNFAP